MEMGEGTYPLPARGFIVIIAQKPADLFGTAQRLASSAGRDWQITASPCGDPSENAVTLVLDPAIDLPGQGYTIDITSSGIEIRSADCAGLFYGVCTLCQLLDQRRQELPVLRIRDWPDFPVRGVMLDISRDKVPAMQTLLELIDLLASWKINHFELYTEHTFAYRNHRVVWENASPMTGEEILALDKYCSDRFIDLTPNQNSLSHLERWFKHEKYLPLANTRGRYQVPWGWKEGSFTLCPGDPGSLDLIRDLYNDLLPHFSSRYFNVGCDEAHDLNCERSREISEKIGVGRVYLEYLLRIYEEVKKRGKTMLFWDDIVLRHPELIPEIPRDVIALDWGYEADHPIRENAAKLRDSGLEFWECPGTSSWNSIAGRTVNCMGNLRNAAVDGLAAGASGYLNTDWGDSGHWQHLPVSYLGFLYGAAVSWNTGDEGEDLADALSIHAFRDEARVMGQVAFDLGRVHEHIARKTVNNTIIWQQFLRPLEDLTVVEDTTPDEFANAQSAAEDALSKFGGARMKRPDAELIKAEFANAVQMIRLGCLLGQLRIKRRDGVDAAGETSRAARDFEAVITEYTRLWPVRNRPGGFKESVARLEARRDELL